VVTVAKGRYRNVIGTATCLTALKTSDDNRLPESLGSIIPRTADLTVCGFAALASKLFSESLNFPLRAIAFDYPLARSRLDMAAKAIGA